MRRPLCPALIALCAAGMAARAGEFLPVRDENPLVRAYYLPLPEDGRSGLGGDFTATASLSNTLNVESRGAESLLVDGESTTLRFTWEGALNPRWHYRVGLPLIHDSGGSFDALIDGYHRALGFSRGYRPQYPRSQIDYRYQGLARINLDAAQSSFGDLAIETGYYLLDDTVRTLSLWSGLEAPTGVRRNLTGDGAWDGALLVHYVERHGRWHVGAEAGMAEPFGDGLFAGHAHHLSGFTRVAVGRAVGAAWTLQAQLDAQTRRVAGSALRLTGPSLQGSLGLARQLSTHWLLQCGFAEDVAVNTAPDITFFLGIRRQSRAE